MSRILSFLTEKKTEIKQKKMKLTEEQRKSLVNRIENRARHGEPFTAAEIMLEAARMIGKEEPLSRHWFDQFMRENNQITARTPSVLTAEERMQ